MENDERDIFRFLYKFVYGDMESLGGQIVGSLDVAAAVVIVPDIDDEVVFAGLFVALYYLRQFLLRILSVLCLKKEKELTSLEI